MPLTVRKHIFFALCLVFTIAALEGLLNDDGMVVVVPAAAAVLTALLGLKRPPKL